MRVRLVLSRRFWNLLLVFALLTFLGIGVTALLVRNFFAGGCLLAGGIVFLVMLLDGRLTKERKVSLADTLVVLAAVPMVFFAIVPLLGELITDTWAGRIFLACMLLLAGLVGFEAWRSYREAEGRT